MYRPATDRNHRSGEDRPPPHPLTTPAQRQPGAAISSPPRFHVQRSALHQPHPRPSNESQPPTRQRSADHLPQATGPPSSLSRTCWPPRRLTLRMATPIAPSTPCASVRTANRRHRRLGLDRPRRPAPGAERSSQPFTSGRLQRSSSDRSCRRMLASMRPCTAISAAPAGSVERIALAPRPPPPDRACGSAAPTPSDLHAGRQRSASCDVFRTRD
jgi:hypothetical protein